MLVVVESSMFCYGISKFISNHTSVGFDFIKAYGRVWDLLIMETVCSKSLTCVCLLCKSGYKSCFST